MPSWNVGRQIRLIVLGFIVSGWRIEPHKIISIIPNSYILYSNSKFSIETNIRTESISIKAQNMETAIGYNYSKKKTPIDHSRTDSKNPYIIGNLHSNTDNVIIINIAKNMQRIAVRCVHFAECRSTISNFAFEVHFAYGVMCRCVCMCRFLNFDKYIYFCFNQCVIIMEFALRVWTGSIWIRLKFCGLIL